MSSAPTTDRGDGGSASTTRCHWDPALAPSGLVGVGATWGPVDLPIRRERNGAARPPVEDWRDDAPGSLGFLATDPRASSSVEDVQQDAAVGGQARAGEDRPSASGTPGGRASAALSVRY